jgi:type I restriction enzyme S subunit
MEYVMDGTGKHPRWPMVKLGDVCEILDYKRIPITKNLRKSGLVPYYGATGIVDHVDGYLFDEKLVLVGEDGAKWDAGCDTAFIIDGKSWVNNHAHVIRPNRAKLIDSWLVYYLNFRDLSEYVSGVTVPKLNQGNLINIPLPLPPLAEQQRIVARLDAAFAAIDEASAAAASNARNARALFESYLDQVFSQRGAGWVERRLGEVCEIKNGKNQKEVQSPTGKYPILGSAGTVMGYATEYICESGTTIIGRKGTIDNPIYIEERFWNVDTAFGLSAKNNLDKRYLYYFCLSFDFKKLNRGTTLPSLVKSELLTITLPLPPLAEQQRIVHQLDRLIHQTTQLTTSYERKVAALAKLKQSLLAEVFGE